MTTITKEWLQQTIAEFENTRDDIPFGLDDDDAKILKVLKQALASFEAEPVGEFYHEKQDGWYQISEGDKVPDNRRIPLYTAPPVQETGVYKDVLNIIGLLENNEWAEHCTSTVLGSLLESEITRLVDKEQPAPVVPEEITADGIIGMHECGFVEGWNACRTAMLNGDIFRENSISSTNNFREIAETSTNSPVIPDCWVMVPKEPTDEMIAAAMECDDVVFDSKDPTAFCVQFREIYCAMVDTAPKPEQS